jgi:hypothetical protein
MPDEVEIARVVREIRVLEARLIAARHLKLADRIRLLESEKRRLETTLAEAQAEPCGATPECSPSCGFDREPRTTQRS